MATWVVGDIQGCLEALQTLLRKAGFDWRRDRLWCVGDLVNRGTDCLGTLRYLHERREQVTAVLGNHDLHLLASAAGERLLSKSDTLAPILAAPDREALLGWLRSLPLVHREAGHLLVHAGVPPCWTLDEAELRAREVEAVLGGDDAPAFFAAMYGNEPDCWDPALEGMARLRVITNYCTRMRFCDGAGRLDLRNKEAPAIAGWPNDERARYPRPKADAFDAWFLHRDPDADSDTIVFGHWAALEGRTHHPRYAGLDTGCVWGGALTLYCLETGQRVSLPCGAA